MTAKKTSTNNPAKKSTSKRPATKTKTAATECPKGGAHEWQQDDDGAMLCANCLEPAPLDGKTKAKSAGAKATAKKPKPTAKAKKLSALDAAVKVLSEAKEPMNTRQMIEAMAAKGYWSSPNGQTPAATLYSAILRQINAKGKDARFKKTDRGQFAFNG